MEPSCIAPLPPPTPKEVVDELVYMPTTMKAPTKTSEIDLGQVTGLRRLTTKAVAITPIIGKPARAKGLKSLERPSRT